ncbi:MAG TPA: capsule assembly Wzi family protein [Longimicrobiales bacterium]|nr:capsule assembly Wzi family protein [Longimicrobiales bacterium]
MTGLLRRKYVAPAMLAAPLALAAAPLGAQSPVLLPSDHWAVDAVRRLDAMGILPVSPDRGRRRLTLGEVERLLGAADADAAFAGLLSSYRSRFTREFGTASGGGKAAPWIVGFVGAAVVLRENEFGTGSGTLAPGPGETIVIADRAPGPRRVDDHRLEPHGWVGAGVGPIGATAQAHTTMTGDGVYEAHLAVRVGAIAAWGGRAGIGYGPGRHGSLVLGGEREVVGGGWSTVRPFRLPWLLRALGDLHVESFLGTLRRSGDIEDPWLWGLRVSTMPHPRLGFGVSRAAMFGGDRNGGFDLGHFMEIIALERRPGLPFENQIGALDAWFRPPLPGLPLVIWAEWGADDTAGALFQVPGLVTGVEIPAWPGSPWLAISGESTWMAPRCCANGPWYWHSFFPSGWAVEGEPLGHPLGGEGTELLLGIDVSPARLAAELSLDLFRRDRGPDNLYSPRWEGVSHGGELRAGLRGARWELVLSGYGEQGDGWRRFGSTLGTRIRF